MFIVYSSRVVDPHYVLHDILKYHNNYDRPTHNDVCSYLLGLCESLKKTLAANPLKGIPGKTNAHHVPVQLLLLVFCRCSLDRLTGFVDLVRAPYISSRRIFTDPRRVSLTRDLLRDAVIDACFYEDLEKSVSDLSSATTDLLDLLQVNFKAERNFTYLAAETRAICTGLIKRSTDFSTTLDNHLHLFELLRGYEESRNVWTLGILASVFLPLSLATGILSMQSRLADLHLVLYDFCGVIVLLGTAVLIIITLLKKYKALCECMMILTHGSWYNMDFYPIFRYWFWVFCFGACGLLSSSFIVGMTRSVELGWRILGYGVLAFGGMIIVLFLGFVLRICLRDDVSQNDSDDKASA